MGSSGTLVRYMFPTRNFQIREECFVLKQEEPCFLQDGCNQPDYSLSDAWNWYDCMAMGVAV